MIAFHPLQDPISNDDGTTHALGCGSSKGQASIAVCVTGDIAHTLKAEGFDASEDGTGRGQPIVASFTYRDAMGLEHWPDDEDDRDQGNQPNVAATPDAATSRSRGAGTPISMLATANMAVRRLTPRECERLQGMRDDYTLIPTKKAKKRSKMYDYAEIDGQLWQLAADGPRYKALGNSMAVPNMRWLGKRIGIEIGRIEAIPSP